MQALVVSPQKIDRKIGMTFGELKRLIQKRDPATLNMRSIQEGELCRFLSHILIMSRNCAAP